MLDASGKEHLGLIKNFLIVSSQLWTTTCCMYADGDYKLQHKAITT